MFSKPRGISASRGAAVLGLSEFQTPFEVWQRIMEEREPGFNAKNSYVLPEDPDSAAIRWGLVFEDAVIELAEKAQGKKITWREMEFCHKPNYDFITCHIDGVYTTKGILLHEGKTTSAFSFREKWGEPGTDKIPRTYQIQVQHQMLCTGAKEAIVSVLVFPETPDKWEKDGWEIVLCTDGIYNLFKTIDSKMYSTQPEKWANVLSQMGYFHQYYIRANTDVQKHLVKAYREFWHNHILTGKPPEPRNYDDIKRLCPEPVGTIVCDTQMTAWYREYQSIKKEIGATGNAKKRQDKLKLRILDKMRKLNPVIDDESQDKVIFRDTQGNKLGQYSKTGGFR